MPIEDTYMSFHEWSLSGYYIKRGEKSTKKDPLGIPQFHIGQVLRMKWHTEKIIEKGLDGVYKDYRLD